MASPEREPGRPRTGLRASDADRERVAEELRRHYGAGRLSAEDLSERVDAVFGARTMSELEALTADLPTDDEPAVSGRRGLPDDFRIHFAIYAVVNLMLVGIWAASGGGYFWPIWPMLGWGIGVGCHAASLLGRRGTPPSRRVAPARDGTRRTGPEAEAGTSVDEVASTVAYERPSLRPAAAPDGTVTILFSDIEASTALNERLGDVRWLELLREHHRLVREQIQACGGFEVKSQGDGFMVAFPSARRAVHCAQAIRDAVAADLGEHPDGPVRVRIGLHTGEAIRDESDFYGKNVAIAARIADQARGGEILASSLVKQLTESAGDINFEDARDLELAGLAGTHAVYKIV
jgi:class 3 adenylate cyclase